MAQLGPNDVTYGNGSLTGANGLGVAGYIYGNALKTASNILISDIEGLANLANAVQGRGYLNTDLSFAKFGNVDADIQRGVTYAQYAAGAKGAFALGKAGLQFGARHISRFSDELFDGFLDYKSSDYAAFGAADNIRVNLNRNDAVSDFAVYEIEIFGELEKVGKADAARITKSSGLPTRLHSQIRQFIDTHGELNVSFDLTPVGEVTTAYAKSIETSRLVDYYQSTGKIPPGNRKSFKP